MPKKGVSQQSWANKRHSVSQNTVLLREFMKNGLYAFLFIVVAGAAGHIGMPWWCMALVGAVAALLFPQRPALSFSTAFSAGTLLWYASAFVLNTRNAGLLSAQTGSLFLGLKGFHLLLLTGLLGGTITGLGALTGALLRRLFAKRPPRRYRGQRQTFRV